MEPITSSEVRLLASQLTQRYRTRLNTVLSTSEGGTKEENTHRDDIRGNGEDNLFDTYKMIKDWIAQQKESPYHIRCKLWEAAVKAGYYEALGCILTVNDKPGRSDLGDQQSTLELLDNLYRRVPGLPETVKSRDTMLTVLSQCQRNYISKNEIQQSMKYLNREQKLQVLERLGIQKSRKTTDEDIVAKLCQWRDERLSSSDMEPRKLFYDTIDALKCQECVAESKEEYVFDAELPDIGLAMLMEDILPFSEALGLDTARLHKYRKSSTARCVLPEIRQLVEEARREKGNSRSMLCESLAKAGFMDIARMTFLGHDQSLSEMYALTSNLNDEQRLSLVKKLGLTQEDIDSCRNTPAKRILSEVITRWTSKKHSPPYYYREGLANAIKSLEHQEEFANKMLKDIKKDVYTMCESVDHLTEGQTKKLASRLGLSDAEHKLVAHKGTNKVGVIRLWRNKLHPASYNYAYVLDEALHFAMADKAVPTVQDDISHKEITEDLLAELPDLTDTDVILVGSHLGVREEDIDSRGVEYDETLELLKCWKRKIHPPLYHYRLELAKALKSLDNLEEYTHAVLSGENVPRGLNRNVMEHIYSSLSKAEIKRIEDIVDVSGHNTADQEGLMNEEQFRSWWNLIVNKLFNEGFSALAQEVILVSCSTSSEVKSKILSEIFELSSFLTKDNESKVPFPKKFQLLFTKLFN